jgi:predicted dithiol-disulfide oxidoreductase (DUF899 family)
MNPGRLETESADYGKLRDELLEAEIALKDQRERVAALRRKLPFDTEFQDYEFHEGPADLTKDGPFPTVRLSELFDDPRKPLVVYQYMYGGAQKRPCPRVGHTQTAIHPMPTMPKSFPKAFAIGKIHAF